MNALTATIIQQANVAQHLNIGVDAIVKIEEWVNVLWVRFQGGCRFVSKKIMKTQTDIFSEIKEEFNGFFPIAVQQMQNRGFAVNPAAKEKIWEKLMTTGTGSGTYSDPCVSPETATAHFPEFLKIAKAIEKARLSQDNRTATEKALDTMYGQDGWSQRDREDYEG